jgi:transketolase
MAELSRPAEVTLKDPSSWDMAVSSRLAQSFVAGDELAAIADVDDRIVVLTADLKFSNRTVEFERRHPERFFNVGIAEQNMVTMAAGMATFGLVPYVVTFASFVGLLCAEQMRTDLAYPGLPVRVLGHHAGISLGFYGTSHHATEDLGVLRSIANMTVVCPCDGAALRVALRQTVDEPGPVYFRLGRGRDADVYSERLKKDPTAFEVGQIATLREGTDLTIVANGVTVAAALAAADMLATEDGVEAAVLDAHTVRPFDAATFCRSAEATGRVLVAEEHNVYGGVASVCADALVDAGVGARLRRVGMPPDEYSLIGPPTHLYRHYGMDAEGIGAAARRLLAESAGPGGA